MPPIPASISSKTSVRSSAAPSPVSASITRESSPPEAASRSGDIGMPAFVDICSSTRSAPAAPNPSGCGSRETSRLAPSIARAASSSATRPVSRVAGLAARRGQLLRKLRATPGCSCEALLQARRHLLGVLQALDLGPAALGVRQDRLDASRRAFAPGDRQPRAAPPPPRAEPGRPRSTRDRNAARRRRRRARARAREPWRSPRRAPGRRPRPRQAIPRPRPPRSTHRRPRRGRRSPQVRRPRPRAVPPRGAGARARTSSSSSSPSSGAAASISASSKRSRSRSRSRAPRARAARRARG